MNAPDPKANTTTEAYLAYKAGYLEESELKPVLYEPYLHFDSWLAYWAGLTNEYPLDKNGDPEMLTDEEALVAYLSGVTDTYPENIKDPYDVRIVGYLKHLVSVRWPEPDYPVNNEEFYLSTMDPTHTSNPVPSSDIELDTAEGKIISVEAYGDTYQQTFSGYQLLPTPYASGDSRTHRGITYEVNPDGTITMNGQNDGTASSAYFFVDRYGTMPLFELEAGTYYFIPNNADVRYEMYDGTNYYSFNSSNNYTVTFANSVSIRQIYTVVIRTNTTNYNNYKLYPMLTKLQNPTTADYEPYTGSTSAQASPAPNPDYPQDIQVVTGAQTVNVYGKNLINIPNFTSSQQGINAKGSNQTIELTGTAGNTYYPDFRFYKNGTYGSRAYRSTVNQIDSSRGFFTEPNSEYKLSIFVEGDTVYNIVEGFETKVTNNLGLVGNQVITINDSERLNFVSISISQNVKADIKVRFQIEKGSTATSYEPYQGQSYAIDLTGKNLWSSTLEVGGISSTGASLARGDRVNSAMKVLVQPNTTYTLSAVPKVSGKNINVAIQGWKEDDSFISQITGNSWMPVPVTFTTPANCYKITLNGRYTDDTIFGTVGDPSDAFQEIQLELGLTATPYAPYYNYELCKIGDYQDYIYKSGDDWYVHKMLYKYTFTGEEPWQLRNTTAEGVSTFSWTFDDVPDYYRGGSIGAGAGTGICTYLTNHGTVSNANQMYYSFIGFSFYYRSATLTSKSFYANTKDADLTAFETGIAGQALYYLLATPTDTKITDATLISQLEALAGADTYNKKTYIKVTATDPNLPALLKVEAYKY